jgi:ornithine carbamoyltransferase
MSAPRHFLDLQDIPVVELRAMLDTAARLKSERQAGVYATTLKGKKLAMIFEKKSTRTRVSFEVAMLELGGWVLPFSSGELQLGRGETMADTARVLSRYVDALMIRCHAHDTLVELTSHASIPIINGLSDRSHPCQVMADILTFEERRGPIAGKTLAWVGDGNNMARTFVTAAVQLGFRLRLACPGVLAPPDALLEWAKKRAPGQVTLTHDPEEAVSSADAVIADAWVSMGDDGVTERVSLLTPYQVNGALMKHAKKDALFMHCLPAHRGEEVTADVIDGPQSVVWDEAENRLHVQKAVLLWCLGML